MINGNSMTINIFNCYHLYNFIILIHFFFNIKNIKIVQKNQIVLVFNTRIILK